MSTWDYQIQLIGLVDGVDGDGFPITEEVVKDPILANKLSVHSSEYWNANRSGVELSKTFEIHAFEYAGEEKLVYNNDTYSIKRTFEKDELIELVCEKRADEHVV